MIKKLLLGVMVLAVGVLVAAPRPVSAQLLDSELKKEACAGVSGTADGRCDANADSAIEGVVKMGLNILSWVVGLIAVIMIVVGGLKYITSSGESTNVNSAKNTILYAIIGLVVVIMAQAIVHFVINKTDPAAQTTMNTLTKGVSMG